MKERYDELVDIVNVIEKEGAECVMPDFMDFLFYSLSGGVFRHRELAFDKKTEKNSKLGVWVLERYRRYIKKCLLSIDKILLLFCLGFFLSILM